MILLAGKHYYPDKEDKVAQERLFVRSFVRWEYQDHKTRSTRRFTRRIYSAKVPIKQTTKSDVVQTTQALLF